MQDEFGFSVVSTFAREFALAGFLKAAVNREFVNQYFYYNISRPESDIHIVRKDPIPAAIIPLHICRVFP